MHHTVVAAGPAVCALPELSGVGTMDVTAIDIAAVRLQAVI